MQFLIVYFQALISLSFLTSLFTFTYTSYIDFAHCLNLSVYNRRTWTGFDRAGVNKLIGLEYKLKCTLLDLVSDHDCLQGTDESNSLNSTVIKRSIY